MAVKKVKILHDNDMDVLEKRVREAGLRGYRIVGPATSMGSRIVVTLEHESDTVE